MQQACKTIMQNLAELDVIKSFGKIYTFTHDLNFKVFIEYMHLLMNIYSPSADL